jgi:glycosyltransferase involved in cell wall biosynthesis
MRLLFLSNLYPPYEIGGYEQLCQEVTLHLRQRGHAVHILTSRHGRKGAPPLEQDVIRTLYLQADVNHYQPPGFFLKRTRQEQWNQRELRRVVDQIQPDLMVIWGMWDLSRNLPYWAEQWMPGRVVYYIASYWPADADIHVEYWQAPANRRISELLKRPMRSAALGQLRREGYPPALRFDRAVCVSRYVRDTLVKAGKLPAHSGILFNGIDPEPILRHAANKASASDGTLRLLFFGSLLPHKGVHTAIEAMGLLKQRGCAERVTLTILGGGHPDYETQLHELVDELKVADRVVFAGRVSRDDVPAWLNRFDVFLFTSIWPEPMARTVMEAMAAGLLVIGTEVGGQVEMLNNGQNALTFRPADPAGLADQLERVLNEPALLKHLAEAGRQLVLERFTLERMLDDIEAFLAKQLGRTAGD